jgi:glycosyltransferase involved in cell wall biosynthesis
VKFLQLFPFYGEYIADFHRRFPDTAGLPYAEQKRRLVADGYSIVHMFSRYLAPQGFETDIVFTEFESAQRQWLKEQGRQLRDPSDWRHEIAALQVNAYRPDVLYVTEPVGYDARFLARLTHRPRLIMGWKAATIPPQTDWRGFDLILSNFAQTFERGPSLGVRRVEFFTPGFPTNLRDELPDEGKFLDVSFIGSISSEHLTRTRYLSELAKSQLTRENDFSLGYYLRTAEPHLVPVGVAMHNRGGCWGSDMFRVLKGSRIALNIGVDHAKGETGNMRMIETGGLGTFLLTEYQDNIRKYFEPGVEAETFASQAELEEKIRFYLDHPDEREAIAARGRARCQREFSMDRAVVRLAELIRTNLR